MISRGSRIRISLYIYIYLICVSIIHLVLKSDLVVVGQTDDVEGLGHLDLKAECLFN